MRTLFTAAANVLANAISSIVNSGNYNNETHVFTMDDNELIDDVSERFGEQIYVSSAVPVQVVNKKLNATTISQEKMNTVHGFYIAPNEQFSIEAKANISAFSTNNGCLAAVWPSAGGTGSSWQFTVTTARALAFYISDNNGTSYTLVKSADAVVPLSTDFHACVERDENNLITLYLNGVVVATQTVSIGSTRNSEKLRIAKGYGGDIWDLVLRHKKFYGGVFTPPGKLGKVVYNEKYQADVAADIVLQLPFRRNNPCNEVNGTPLALTQDAVVEKGSVKTANNTTCRYSIGIDYFGAADFTIEYMVSYTAIYSSDGFAPLAHWYNGGSTNIDNRWVATIKQDGSMAIVFTDSQALSATGSYVLHTLPAGTFTAGPEHHVVIERYNGVYTVYVNGVAKASWENSTPLWALTGNLARNNFSLASPGAASNVWNIRIAKRAMYKGNVVTPVVFPKMPTDFKDSKAAGTMMIGSSNNASVGAVAGFAKDLLYGGVTISVGELYPQVYYNTDIQSVVRIKGIFMQANTYLCIAWAPSTEQPTADMPRMTNRVRIGGVNGSTFVLTNGSSLGTKNDNDTGKYYSPNATTKAVFNVDESSTLIEFV